MASSRVLLAAAALIAIATGFASGAAQADDDRGEKLFKICSPCHGVDAIGNLELGAPAIAGMDAWYLEAQLKKFQTGARGAHPDDNEGMRMRPMSRALKSDDDNRAVSAYVAGLEPAQKTSVLAGGDSTRGKVLFTPCTACHGPQGRGNPQLNGPPLNHSSDWYLYRQIEKFKAGVRGTDPKDTTGALMRPMAMTLFNDQAVRDVVAYIMTLPN